MHEPDTGVHCRNVEQPGEHRSAPLPPRVIGSRVSRCISYVRPPQADLPFSHFRLEWKVSHDELSSSFRCVGECMLGIFKLLEVLL